MEKCFDANARSTTMSRPCPVCFHGASVNTSTSWLRANRTMHPISNCMSRGDCLGESSILFKWVVSVNNRVHVCIA